MKRLIWFAAPLVLAFGALAGGGTSVLAAGPPSTPPGQGPCSHGNSGKDCRPDPSPNGQDCDAHGKDDVGGMNEDHCLGASTPTTPTTPTTPSTSTTSDNPDNPDDPGDAHDVDDDHGNDGDVNALHDAQLDTEASSECHGSVHAPEHRERRHDNASGADDDRTGQ